MILNKGFFKMIHAFPYGEDASFETRCEVIKSTLKDVKQKGYDGIVSNVDYMNGYFDNEDNWKLMEENARLCEELGLRLWIYDEKGYPSGAAGINTLKKYPEIEAVALAAVYKVLNPGESETIALPCGHLKNIAAFGFYFEGDFVTNEALCQEPIKVPYSDNGYLFENKTDKKLLCLAFFTKPAFEGTHAQHNTASERRYIDIGNSLSGKAFIENTYRPYNEKLKKYIENGTIEAFFADESSYLAVYFNIKKKPRTTTHLVNENIPLWAMVNWSNDLPESFFAKYGYNIEENLPSLFLGNSSKDKQVRKDFYTMLTELAQNHFFKPISDFCKENGTRFSGHILLEERITDHPRYEGNFFSYLKNMQIPGMDMLDSLPERVWAKAVTPILTSSVSRLYANGDVMDEVSAHFQNKFDKKVSALQIFNSLVMQYALGANIFTSYYDETKDAILQKTPTGESVLKATKRTMNLIEQNLTPTVAVHYPIEDVMANTTSPVDIAKVFDSTLNEYNIPYPIDRADLDKTDLPAPIIANDSYPISKQIEKSMEECMFALLNKQIPFMFCDTDSIDTLVEKSPKLFVIPAQTPSKELLEQIICLENSGCKVIALTDNGKYTEYYTSVSKNIALINNAAELSKLLYDNSLVKTSGETERIAALWSDSKLLLVNSDNFEKEFVLETNVTSITDCYFNQPVPFKADKEKTCFTLSPYGVFLVETLSGTKEDSYDC